MHPEVRKNEGSAATFANHAEVAMHPEVRKNEGSAATFANHAEVAKLGPRRQS
ncbi:MAG: hypothetical protein PHH26_07485 [Candidatus Thermoplasmatota archaeon]|nr:hypothetical protein [Candidatus Thermoplasmatota archaeon]